MAQDGLPLATCSYRPARPLASCCAPCLLQTTDVLVPDMQREFLVLRDDYARNKSGEVILSLKRIEVGTERLPAALAVCSAVLAAGPLSAGLGLNSGSGGTLAVSALSLAPSACPAQSQADNACVLVCWPDLLLSPG